MTRVLHILTPLSNQTPTSLVEDRTLSAKDRIADFRQFPFAVYQPQANGTCLNITKNLSATLDYEALVREWLIQFTAKTGLQDILVVEGHGLWWTQNALNFRPSLSDLGNSFAWIDLMIELNRQIQPSSVIVYGQYTPIIHLAKQVYRRTTLKIQSEATNTQTAEIPRSHDNRWLVIARVLLGIVYFFYTLIRRPDICFLSTTFLLRTTTVGLKQKLRDVYMHDVVDAFKARGWHTLIIEAFAGNASWKGLIARGYFFPDDLVFVLSSPYLRKIGLYRAIVCKWHQKWADIRPDVTAHLQYRGIDIAPLVLPMLERQFTHLIPYYEIMTKIWFYIFRMWRPKLLYINCFYQLSTGAAIIAARLLNIPTIEQQHGVIGQNHIPYLIPQELNSKSRYPLCDKMIVWGNYTERLLVDTGVYKSEQISICGFPRIDALLYTLPPRSETLARLEIPSEAKVALYTSGVVARNLWSAVLDGIETTPDSANLYWIVKLHPKDKTRSKWEMTISQRQMQNVRVIEHELDFYALLAACDIHISFISTAFIESAVLGKPNLGLTIPYISDPVGYAEAKAFLPVAPDQLGTTVYSILHNSEQRDSLLHEQKAFANDWCLHYGNAVNRFVRVVEDTIDGKLK